VSQPQPEPPPPLESNQAAATAAAAPVAPISPYSPYLPPEPAHHNGSSAHNGSSHDLGPATLPQLLTSPPAEPPPPEPADEAESAAAPRRRRATKRRLPTQKIFSDLATQAAIPAAAYAIGEDVDGAMCLVRTDEGFEVFNSAAGSRHEVRVFTDEESAYFYLFGVLVADSVRTGALAPRE
jgi:hypothetical protein